MKRNPKKFRKAAKVLMDPQPKFVSIVKAGANMTPLLAIKKAGELQEDDMKITAKRSDDHDIAGLRFDKAKFKDAAAVQKWLDNGGYTEYAIVDEETSFSVKGVDGLTDVREVASPDGVTTLVGKRPEEAVKEETDPAAEAEAASGIVAAKADESEPVSKDEAVKEDSAVEKAVKAAEKLVAKQEAPEAAAKEQPVEGEVLEQKAEDEAASETVQPVAQEEAAKHVAKADEIIAEARQKGLYEILDVGSVLYTMAYLVQDADYSKLPPDKVAEIKSAAQNMLDVMDWFMKNTLDNFSAVFQNAPQEQIPAEEISVEKTEESAPAETAEKADTASEPSNELAALTEQVNNLAKAVEVIANAVSQKASGEDDGVKPARQTRKGADASDEKPAPKVVSKEDQEFNSRMTRNLFGY